MSTIIEESTLSEVEQIKADSLGLRGPLQDEVANDETHLTEAAKQILKFHGSYQQEDRDVRRERKKAGLEPAYSFMIRSKLPGGAMTAEQYLLHDRITDQYGDSSLRITTRQGFQLYGVVKQDLRNTIHELNAAMVTTFGACGDVVRNVVTCPAPLPGGNRQKMIKLAREIAFATLPRSRSYHDIWVEGQQVTTSEAPVADPLYLDRYLPRKFKVGFAFPDDNCTDVFSNDLGYVVIEEEGEIVGYNVLVGGGYGMTHGKTETMARLASPLGFAKPDELLELTKAVIAVQRDHGNRENRRLARMKYLIEARGVDWFRERVEENLGRPLAPYRPVEVDGIEDHLGWHDQGDGRWFLGVWVENGRVKDDGDFRLRTALRTIVEEFQTDVHLTTQQNLLLTNVQAADRERIDAILSEHGVVSIDGISPTRRWAMACPALPTCPLAVAESERVLPQILDELDIALARLGLNREALAVRMTGCPNGCARPYTADLAFVGRSLGKYMVYVGGNLEGTRLGDVYADLIPLGDLVETVRPLLERFANERSEEEGFGDFWRRVGLVPLPMKTRAAR